MSNSGGSNDPASDLQGLFASLKSSVVKNHAASKEGSPLPTINRQPHPFDFSGDSASPQPQYLEQRQSATMSPSFSPSLYGSQTRGFPPNTGFTQSNTPAPIGDRPSSDRASNLLNLLKFNTPVSSPHASIRQQQSSGGAHQQPGNYQASPSAHSVHGRGISASDLVASFMGKPSTPTPREIVPASSSTNHQVNLLNLLNRATASQPIYPEKKTPSSPTPRDGEVDSQSIAQKLPDRTLKEQSLSTASDEQTARSPRNISPIRVFGSTDDKEPTPFEPHDLEPVAKKDTIFTYVNPFEQLAASSPRNAKPKSSHGDGHKRKIIEPPSKSAQTSSRRKLTPAGSEVLQSIESPKPTKPTDEHSQLETLMGIGASSRNAETVTEALNEVGDKVDKEVGHALAKAEGEEKATEIKREERDDTPEITEEAFEQQIQEIASEVKQELEKDENEGLLEEFLPKDIAEEVKDTIDEVAGGNIADDWESAEGEQAKRTVNVYQFPMRPFVVIDFKPSSLPKLTTREDSWTSIARLKKEFDQIDRTLVTATNDFIVYGSPKAGGGLKVIRQDNGVTKHIFSDTHDRIFNVSISTAHPASPVYGVQTVIATGLSGTVYWATILKPGEDVLESNIKDQGLIFPPSPAQLENTSGGQLKTRAKKSCRNPDFFAIGRGKSIHVVFPMHARNSKFLKDGLVVDTEKYFKDRNLRINTGKAGKDFTFSEDDSTILTLDKTGRLRFWDIRELVDENNSLASTVAPIELKTSIMTYATANPSEKSWPTSVLLVDKLRPYTKGIALRYVIVGMKQNHTLQLWDLCLGKAVQEVNFPHEKECDAICSITYHPHSGMVVVGHPTRNSICLLHLSAPRYNLPPISQAKFLQRLANKDSTLPKAEATAILSGVREYSFANIGLLRSVELVPSAGEQARSVENDEDPMMFELYVMHSKGVVCLEVKKEDVGWSKNNRVLHPIDAEKDGYITVKELKEPHSNSMSEPSSTNDVPSTSTATKVIPKGSSKAANTPPNKPEAKQEGLTASAPALTTRANSEKSEKKKKKRSGAGSDNVLREQDQFNVSGNASALSTTDPASALAAQRVPTAAIKPSSRSALETGRPAIPKNTSVDAPEFIANNVEGSSIRSHANGESYNIGISGDFLDKELKKIEKGVSDEFNRTMSRELDSLYQRFTEDKRVQDAAGMARQDAILRLVSSTLGDNVEKALARIIATNIQDAVIPAITNATMSTLNKIISEVVTQELHHAIPPLLKLALPEAISGGVQDPEVLRLLSEQVTKNLTVHVEKEFETSLHDIIMPTFESHAADLVQKSGVDMESRVREHLRRAEIRHKDDGLQIDQLMLLVRGLSETVHTMAAAQSEFQQQILKLQQQAVQDRHASIAAASSSSPEQSQQESSEARMTPKSPEQEELDMIMNLMTDGRFEEGTIQVWI